MGQRPPQTPFPVAVDATVTVPLGRRDVEEVDETEAPGGEGHLDVVVTA